MAQSIFERKAGADLFLPQVEKFKYLRVLFTNEGKMDREIDKRIGVNAVMQSVEARPEVVVLNPCSYPHQWPKERDCRVKQPKLVSSVGLARRGLESSCCSSTSRCLLENLPDQVFLSEGQA